MRWVKGKSPILHVDQAQAAAREAGGSTIKCKGCGEIGTAFWEPHISGRVIVERIPQRVKGNFYLHNGNKIACGRCQQIYRLE